MSIERFFNGFYFFRALSVGLVTLFVMACMIKGYTHTLDIEIRGPEHERLDDSSRDRENERAAERVNRNEREGNPSNSRDYERACAYERDHGV